MSVNAEMLAELLDAWETGADAPAHLLGTLAMDDAYTLQIELLRARRAQGLRASGWKVGQTNAAMRAGRGEAAPAPGFLLASGALGSGADLDLGGAGDWFLEPELAVIVGEPLGGAAVDADGARAAIRAVVPAFELVRQHPGWKDRALQRAVNGSNAGYVLGAEVPGCPSAADLDDLRIEVTRDGASEVSTRAGDVNDNPLDTVAWLARHLHAHGERLSPGEVILTGSYSALLPLAPGQSWASTVGALGEVTLRTV